MCRLAAYLGPNINLATFLLEPAHSLYKQSWNAEEMQDATVNADGFGFCWLSKDKRPLSYKSTLPIWSDNNLTDLSTALHSSLWLANVRSATPGQVLSEANTQPFIKNDLIFLHNGFIKPFSNEIKSALIDHMDNDTRASIQGNTDSEYIFALIAQRYQQHHDIVLSITEAMQLVAEIDNISAMLNIIIYKDNTLYICRHAINAACPSLY